MSNVEGYQSLVPGLLTIERDNMKTAVDTEAAKLTAQKLTENGIKGKIKLSFTFTLTIAQMMKNLNQSPMRKKRRWRRRVRTMMKILKRNPK